VDPAIKKRVDFYRSHFLLGPEDEVSLGPWWNGNLTTEQASQMADLVAHTMFNCGDGNHYEPDVLKTAYDCFRLDPESPLQQRLLLLILAHVVFGRGRKRGRAKDSKNWTSLKWHQLAALYLEMRSEHPKLSDNKIAERIASRWRVPKEVIRKRISSRGQRGWIEHLEKCERERPGSIQMYGEHLAQTEKGLAEKLSYKITPFKKPFN
jgi:hypothetical protein